MPRLLLATTNLNKAAEIRQMLDLPEDRVLTLADLPHIIPPEETGDSFAANALIKARRVANTARMITLADDSGLTVDYLDGAPGVLSARFAGPDASYEEKNRQILQLLKDVPEDKRTAAFVCSMVVVRPFLNDYQTFNGRLEGRIALEPVGDNGFGYDPIFFLPERGCTLAQLSAEEKNAISHRAKALQAALPYLLDILAD